MRLLTFDDGGRPALAARVGDEVVDLCAAIPDLTHSLRTLIAAGRHEIARVEEALITAGGAFRWPVEGIRHLPPIPDPGKIVCLGLNYADHAKEGGHAKPDYPSFFLRTATTLVAHESPIVRPRASEQLDFEAELVAVVGTRARHLAREDALSAIFGYSIFNDASVRDYQKRTSQWTIGKNFDATGGFGPEIVTVDELASGATGLRIRSRLNGETMQDANTSDMLVDVAEAVSLLSECMTLEPGDLIAMGTPSGVGFARTPPVWMKAGDVCEVEIEEIGTLRNPVVDESA